MMIMEAKVERLVTVERASDGAYRTIPMYTASMSSVTTVANFRNTTLLNLNSKYYVCKVRKMSLCASLRIQESIIELILYKVRNTCIILMLKYNVNLYFCINIGV